MIRRTLALAALLAAMGLAGLSYWRMAPPEISVTLPTEDGLSELVWQCRMTNGEAAARANAAKAHTAFQQGLEAITRRAGQTMQQAMEAAAAAGTIPEDLPAIDEAAEAEKPTPQVFDPALRRTGGMRV